MDDIFKAIQNRKLVSRKKNKLSASLAKTKISQTLKNRFCCKLLLQFQFRLNSLNEVEELESLADKDSKH